MLPGDLATIAVRGPNCASHMSGDHEMSMVGRTIDWVLGGCICSSLLLNKRVCCIPFPGLLISISFMLSIHIASSKKVISTQLQATLFGWHLLASLNQHLLNKLHMSVIPETGFVLFYVVVSLWILRAHCERSDVSSYKFSPFVLTTLLVFQKSPKLIFSHLLLQRTYTLQPPFFKFSFTSICGYSYFLLICCQSM